MQNDNRWDEFYNTLALFIKEYWIFLVAIPVILLLFISYAFCSTGFWGGMLAILLLFLGIIFIIVAFVLLCFILAKIFKW